MSVSAFLWLRCILVACLKKLAALWLNWLYVLYGGRFALFVNRWILLLAIIWIQTTEKVSRIFLNVLECAWVLVFFLLKSKLLLNPFVACLPMHQCFYFLGFIFSLQLLLLIQFFTSLLQHFLGDQHPRNTAGQVIFDFLFAKFFFRLALFGFFLEVLLGDQQV